MVLFRCIIIVLFGPILMESFVLFSNACSIKEVMLCNQNLTKLDVLTLLSSNMSAPTLLLSEYLKNGPKKSFCLYFANSHFLFNFKKILNILNPHKIYGITKVFLLLLYIHDCQKIIKILLLLFGKV